MCGAGLCKNGCDPKQKLVHPALARLFQHLRAVGAHTSLPRHARVPCTVCVAAASPRARGRALPPQNAQTTPTLAPSHTTAPHPHLAAYAEKQGGGTSLFGQKSWKKRYFTLTPAGVLAYFDSNTAVKPLKPALDLSRGYSLLVPQDGSNEVRVPPAGRMCVFVSSSPLPLHPTLSPFQFVLRGSVGAGREELVLRCPNAAELETFLRAISATGVPGWEPEVSNAGSGAGLHLAPAVKITPAPPAPAHAPAPAPSALDTWMQSVNEERPPTPPRGRPQTHSLETF